MGRGGGGAAGGAGGMASAVSRTWGSRLDGAVHEWCRWGIRLWVA